MGDPDRPHQRAVPESTDPLHRTAREERPGDPDCMTPAPSEATSAASFPEPAIAGTNTPYARTTRDSDEKLVRQEQSPDRPQDSRDGPRVRRLTRVRQESAAFMATRQPTRRRPRREERDHRNGDQGEAHRDGLHGSEHDGGNDGDLQSAHRVARPIRPRPQDPGSHRRKRQGEEKQDHETDPDPDRGREAPGQDPGPQHGVRGGPQRRRESDGQRELPDRQTHEASSEVHGGLRARGMRGDCPHRRRPYATDPLLEHRVPIADTRTHPVVAQKAGGEELHECGGDESERTPQGSRRAHRRRALRG